MSSSELETLIARVGDLPAMPTVAVKIMEMVGDPMTSVRALQGMISRDQALTAKVLKIANSAMFGVSRDITTLSHAIVILGFTTLRSIVLAASTKSIYFRGASVRGFSSKLLWEHSLASALVARQLAVTLKSPFVEEAFIAGLLHDIGKNVLNVNFHDKYSQVIQEVYNKGGDFKPMEQRLLGFDHTQVGTLVLRKWNLSEELEMAVLFHHNPEKSEKNKKLNSIVALGNEIANKLEIGPARNKEIDLYASSASEELGLSSEKLDSLLESASEFLKKDNELFSV